MESSAEALEKLGCVRLGLQAQPTGKKPKHSDPFFPIPASKLSVGKPPKVSSDLCVLRNRLASIFPCDVFHFFDSSLNLNVANPDNPKSLKAEPQSKHFFLPFYFSPPLFGQASRKSLFILPKSEIC